MSNRSIGTMWPLALAVVMLVTGTALWAQDRPGRDRGERGERQQVDREERREAMRERMEQRREAMAERQRQMLGATEEEWEVLREHIDAVRQLQAEVFSGGRFMAREQRGERAPRAERREAREPSPLAQAHRDLRQLLRDDDAADADIQQALATLREARDQHEQQLSEAREELREIVTSRQEAQLVIMGVLD